MRPFLDRTVPEVRKVVGALAGLRGDAFAAAQWGAMEIRSTRSIGSPSSARFPRMGEPCTTVQLLEPRLVPLGGICAMTVRRTLPQRQGSLVGS